jgi:uncharacterized protein (DUF58 family)
MKIWNIGGWTRVWRGLEERLRERITRTGFFYVLACALIGLAAFASANNLLFLLLAAMLATLMVSGFISRLGLAGLELDLRLPDHLSARRTVGARLQLRNSKRVAPSFSIHLAGVEGSAVTSALYFPVVPGGASLEEFVDVKFERRGLHREDSFEFTSRFPFGFAERRVRVVMRHDIIVYPCLETRPEFEQLLQSISGEVEARMRGRGHDFYRIRPYEPLESARHVDWRATAHTGNLQVREFAREQESLVVVALDLDAPEEQGEWFERAVECAAWLVWHLAESGARVRFRTQEYDRMIPVEADAYTILKYLALVERKRATALTPVNENESVRVVLSASPARLSEAGWLDARILGPADLVRAEPPAGAGS